MFILQNRTLYRKVKQKSLYKPFKPCSNTLVCKYKEDRDCFHSKKNHRETFALTFEFSMKRCYCNFVTEAGIAYMDRISYASGSKAGIPNLPLCLPNAPCIN